jgi:hypothetical protein
MSVFGTTIDGSDVEAALLRHLRAWMPTYRAELLRQKDPAEEIWANRDNVPEIQSYTVVHEANEKWPEDHLPMLLAYSPGLGQPPRGEGDGTFSGRYLCILTAIASGKGMADTKLLARLYASAARLAVMQHPGLNGGEADADFTNGDGVAWIDHQNYPITKGVDAERNLMGVSDTYLIGVDQILNRDGGPLAPLDNPEEIPDEWPSVGAGKGSVVAELGETFFNQEP